MITRKLLAAAGAAVLTTGLAACGGGSEEEVAAPTTPVEEAPSFEAGTEMARLAEQGSIRVGTKFDQPLFGLQGLGGDLEGFDIEIARAVFGGLGIAPEDIEFVEAVSANREPFLQQDRVDAVIATYTINETRDQVVDFAGPYYVAGQDILVAEGNPLGVQGPEDLAGKTVCSVTGSTPAQNIRENYPEANLVEFDAYTDCRDALQNGQVEAVTTDNVILSGYVSEAQDEFDLVGNPFTEEPYGIGVQEGETEFCEWINERLNTLFENGTWAEIYESTIGTVAGEAPEPPQTGSCETPGAA
jgi:glutamate transport system substrate-binding protein